MKRIIPLLVAAIMFVCGGCGVNEYTSNTQDKNNQGNTYHETENGTETKALQDITEEGIYTLYNVGENCYLTYENGALTLDETTANWQLEQYREGAFYMYAGESELLLDIDNANVTDGTTIKLFTITGYDVQIWNIKANANNTYSIAYSGNNDFCLGITDGRVVLQSRDESNPSQDWIVVKCGDIAKKYSSYVSEGKIIELRMPLDITTVITEERLQKWANDLESAYYTFYQLTNYIPYDNIIVEAYKPCEYIGYVIDNSNIIHIDSEFIYNDLEKMSARSNDWNFCALHEMGHMFDSGRPWVFEAEMMTDLKVAYVLEVNDVEAVPSEFDASVTFCGGDIIKAYESLGGDFSQTYNIYGCAHRFLQIKEVIGWEPFRQTFHYLQENYNMYSNMTRQEKLETFIQLLTDYSGVDVRGYFSSSEWAVMMAGE